MPAPTRPESTLTHRLRALVRTGPLHRIEASKALRTRDLAAHDLRALALRAIDATIEHMGLGYGARRDDLADALAPWIVAAEPQASRADIRDITDLVVEHLLNETNRRLQFDEPYLDFDGTTATMRAVQFRLLQEEEADDGSIVLKATTEAINLYAGMLDVDVEDAQTAAEAVLQAQIQRGAIAAAVGTARQARLRSIEYAETLRRTLRQVRRDVSRVDPREMLRTVADARQHLEQRLNVERSLLSAIDERIATDDEESPAELVELHDALDDCRKRHLDLHHDLLGINETWLNEQERQRFRRSRPSALPDLDRDVLQPLLAESSGRVAPLVDPLVLTLHAAQAPAVLDLAGFVDGLLAARRRPAEADLDLERELLDPVDTVDYRFDPDVVELTERRLSGGGRLSDMLAASRSAGEAPEVRRLLVLRCLWNWDPAVEEATWVEAVGRLRDSEYEGDDLYLRAA